MNKTSTLIAAAMAGISLGALGCASSTPAAADPVSGAVTARHGCKGQNACKGQGGCHG